MSFVSIEYLVFLPAVFVLYWALAGRVRWQNVLLLAASYLFYAWGDWRVLLLLLASSLVTWGFGLAIDTTVARRARRLLCATGVALHVATLVTFKYFSFFADVCGFSAVGLSFYTFQAIAYLVDVTRGKSRGPRRVVDFLLFMAYFPKIVSGPIERADTLLPQLLSPRRFDYAGAVDGCRQALWGLFKTFIVAGYCSPVVDSAWGNIDGMSALSLVVACVLFSFEIYCNFSGYIDIALGTSRLLGIELSPNFRNPYFSRSVPEFWRRWHITLMLWFRDYLYIPLGGSRCRKWRVVLNVTVVFMVVALWHGADATFLLYGLYHAAICSFYVVSGVRAKYSSEVAAGRVLPSLREACLMLVTFSLVTFGRILFRAETLADAGHYVSAIATRPLTAGGIVGLKELALCMAFIAVEWLQRGKAHALQIDECRLFASRPVRWALYVALTLIVILAQQAPQEFIYSQF